MLLDTFLILYLHRLVQLSRDPCLGFDSLEIFFNLHVYVSLFRNIFIFRCVQLPSSLKKAISFNRKITDWASNCQLVAIMWHVPNTDGSILTILWKYIRHLLLNSSIDHCYPQNSIITINWAVSSLPSSTKHIVS